MMREEEKRQLKVLLRDYDARYDGQLCLLGEECHSRGYHTQMKTGSRVHSMERSLVYAVGLMDSGDEEYRKRASDIIREVLKHQDQTPDSATFGIWPYFCEEPLERMCPPDYNSADFCCKMLLQILLDHGNRLDEGLRQRMEQACIYGCQSIIRRDVPVQYTNIAVMDCYVSIMTGQFCDRRDLFQYGLKKLQCFWAFTKSNGGYLEYNSPNYTLLVARDLSLFRNQVKNAGLSALLDEMLDFTWDSISSHFFALSGQWMAPNARCYEDFLTDENLTDIEIATGNIGKFASEFKISVFTYRNRLCCPVKYRKRFTQTQKGFSQVINARGFLYPYVSFPQVSSCYVAESFTLGSFNRSEFWNQIRPLKAFLGTGKTCLRLRVLHDGFDFSSAMLHCVQYENKVLGIINFSDDRGDMHVNLDPIKDRKISVQDLRVRFGIYGELGDVILEKKEGGAQFALGQIRGSIRILYSVLDDEKAQIEVSTTPEGAFCDVVFYHGHGKTVDLGKLSSAVCGFFLEIRDEDEETAVFEVRRESERIKIGARFGRIQIPDMSVEAFLRPVNFLDNGTKDVQCLNGKRLEDYVACKGKGIGEKLKLVAERILEADGSRWEMDIRHFDWVPGVGLYGLCRAYQVTGKREYLKFLLSWAEDHLHQAFAQKTVNSSAPLLTLLFLYEEIGKKEYLQICLRLADEILQNAPLTVDGGLEHTVTEDVEGFSDQIWADTLFMVCIFLARLGKVAGNGKYIDFAAKQLRIHHKFLRDSETGIYYHGWNGKNRNHMSGAHWARANAWILYSTVEILSVTSFFEGREEIENFLRGQAMALRKLQKGNGMFTTLLEDPYSYDEISATAGIVAGIHRAVKVGLLSGAYDEMFVKAVKHFENWIGSGGEVMGVSAGTPVMPDLESYKTIPIRETLYGQGLMLLALAETWE